MGKSGNRLKDRLPALWGQFRVGFRSNLHSKKEWYPCILVVLGALWLFLGMTLDLVDKTQTPQATTLLNILSVLYALVAITFGLCCLYGFKGTRIDLWELVIVTPVSDRKFVARLAFALILFVMMMVPFVLAHYLALIPNPFD